MEKLLPPVEVFYSCSDSSVDAPLLEQLERHLSSLQREGLISTWHKSQILAGSVRQVEMDHHLNTASLILLLVSSDFLASDYCSGTEMQRALQRHETNEAHVIPILLRSCVWQNAPFATLEMLPNGKKPITMWKDRDAAWTDVVTRLRNILGGKPETASHPSPSPIWNIPFQRNPFFTGREELFPILQKQLTSGNMIALGQPQALSGLGGIGKTSMAVEYAYRYRKDYGAILWIQAESWEILVSECVKVATILGLPPKKKRENVVDEVQGWLRKHHRWLLILDNLEEMQILTSFVPTGHQGSILITTRVHTLDPLAQTEVLSTLSEQESVLFLLRRAKKKAYLATPDLINDVQYHEAQEIYLLMDGLPLALDQAGAYISETGCSLASYKSQYIERRAALLKRRGERVIGHPESVETTFSLAYERVKKANIIAADILLACAFLHGDAIPEEFFFGEISYLGHHLAVHSKNWNEAMEILLNYSLITRNSNDAVLSVHKLVQSVLQDKINKKNHTKWGRRVVLALEQIFPSGQYETWLLCERLLPHVFAASALIREDWTSQFEDGRTNLIQAAQLLSRAGQYLYNQAQYTTAEPLLQQALKISTRQLGRDHPTSLSRASDLAALYTVQRKYSEAEPLLEKNVEFLQETPKDGVFTRLHVQYLDKETEWNHLYATEALTMNNQAMLFLETKKYTKARDLFKQVLEMYQKYWNSENAEAAKTISNLAETYRREGFLMEAEAFFQQALTILQQTQGEQHPDYAKSVSNLALLYYNQGKYSEAEPLSVQALAIYEQTLGPIHPETITHVQSLAQIYYAQENFEAADPLCQRVLTNLEQTEKSHRIDISVYLDGLASLFTDEGKEKEAEMLYQHIVAIQEKQGESAYHIARCLNNLATFYHRVGKYKEAEPFYQRAIALLKPLLEFDHPTIKAIQANYNHNRAFVSLEAFKDF